MRRTPRLIAALLAGTTLPLAASEPPATLPRAFLDQLPLLMELSDQEFEAVLATARDTESKTQPAPDRGAKENDHESH